MREKYANMVVVTQMGAILTKHTSQVRPFTRSFKIVLDSTVRYAIEVLCTYVLMLLRLSRHDGHRGNSNTVIGAPCVCGRLRSPHRRQTVETL